MSRPEDLQFRLAQWLLDQLDSRGEFETVSQQIGLLISQAQELSIGELYAHIGKLVFQKMTRIQQGGFALIRLCAQLCCSLLAVHFRQYTTLSPRVSLVHEHILRLCMASIPASATMKSADTYKNDGIVAGPAATDTSVTPPDVSVERICEILLQLHDFQLISTVQVFEYMFRAFEQRKNFIGPRLAGAVTGIHLLLDTCFPDPYFGTWKNEVDYFRKWVDKHACSSTNRVNGILGSSIRTEESRIEVDSEVSTEERRGLGPSAPIFRPAAASNSTSNPGVSSSKKNASNSDKAPAFPNETRLQDYNDKSGEIDGTTGNNYGRPPHLAEPLDSTGGSAKVSGYTKSVRNKSPILTNQFVGLAQPIAPRGPATFRAGPLATAPPAVNNAPRAVTFSSRNHTTNLATSSSIKTTPKEQAITPPLTTAALRTPAKRLAGGVNVVAPSPSQSTSASTTAPLSASVSIANSTRRKVNLHVLFQGGVPIVTTTPPPTSIPNTNTSVKVATEHIQPVAAPPSHESTSSSTCPGPLPPLQSDQQPSIVSGTSGYQHPRMNSSGATVGLQQWPHKRTVSDGSKVLTTYWEDMECYDPPDDDDAYDQYRDDSDQGDLYQEDSHQDDPYQEDSYHEDPRDDNLYEDDPPNDYDTYEDYPDEY